MKFKSYISLGALALSLSASTVMAGDDKNPPSQALIDLMNPALLTSTICGSDGKGAQMAKGVQVASLGAFLTSLSETQASDIPLFEGLGEWSYPVSTDNALAQALFDQGFKLSYNFNHLEAIRAFRAAQKADPECAMCYWGEALALGPNINAPMDPSANAPAYAAAQKALALIGNANEKEADLINALAARYAEDPGDDRSALDQAFADAMQGLAEKYPDDDYIGSLYVEAAMDTTPWDYWEDNGYTPRSKVAEAILKVEEILARNPTHPAAIHLYIHLTEASSTPHKAERHADRLSALMPGAGHLVHMPSHTYYRIGRYIDSLKTNIHAVKADEDYLELVESTGLYRLGYYPHNVHFVLVSAVMAGDVEAALSHAKKLDEVLPIEFASAQPWVQPIKVAPYFAYAKLADPEVMLSQADPGDSLPFIKAIWHYARGEAYIRQGDYDSARAEADAVNTLLTEADFSDMIAGNVPATDILGIAENSLRARLAQEKGDMESAITLWEAAAQIQDNLFYTEPPYWYYPVRQSLGAAYLMNNEPVKAIEAFQAALVEAPNNGWTIFGLAEAYDKAEQNEMADALRTYMATTWVGGDDVLVVENL